MIDDRCEYCGGRFDKPGFFDCDKDCHPVPDLAERIVRAIETDMNGRSGMGFDTIDIDEDIQYEIRDKWVELVRAEIKGAIL